MADPHRSPQHRRQHSRNCLLTRDAVGRARPTCFDLPPEGHAYGGHEPFDSWGVREAMSWTEHVPSPSRRRGVDFQRLNREATRTRGSSPAAQVCQSRAPLDAEPSPLHRRQRPPPAASPFETSPSPAHGGRRGRPSTRAADQACANPHSCEAEASVEERCRRHEEERAKQDGSHWRRLARVSGSRRRQPPVEPPDPTRLWKLQASVLKVESLDEEPVTAVESETEANSDAGDACVHFEEADPSSPSSASPAASAGAPQCLAARLETAVTLFLTVRHEAQDELAAAMRGVVAGIRRTFADDLVKVREMAVEQPRQGWREGQQRYLAWGPEALKTRRPPSGSGVRPSVLSPVVLSLTVLHTSQEELAKVTRELVDRIGGRGRDSVVQVRQVQPNVPAEPLLNQEVPLCYPLRPRMRAGNGRLLTAAPAP